MMKKKKKTHVTNTLPSILTRMAKQKPTKCCYLRANTDRQTPHHSDMQRRLSLDDSPILDSITCAHSERSRQTKHEPLPGRSSDRGGHTRSISQSKYPQSKDPQYLTSLSWNILLTKRYVPQTTNRPQRV